MVGDDQSDLAATDFIDQNLHLPNGTKFEVNQGDVIEEAPQERLTLAASQLAKTTFARMTRSEDERSVQFRHRGFDLAQGFAKRVEPELEKIGRSAGTNRSRKSSRRRNHADQKGSRWFERSHGIV